MEIATTTETGLADHSVSMSNTVARASHELKLGEKRLICMALAMMDSLTRKTLFMAQQRQGFSVKILAIDYAAEFGLDECTAYQQIQDAGKRLFERYIRYEYPGRKKMIQHFFRWVSSAKYAEGEGWIELNFTPEIAPHILSLHENFTTYKLKHTATLDSVYAWRLYEILMSWIGTGIYAPTIEDFHHSMEVPNSLKLNFKDLRVRVIEPALKSINSRTNLMAQYIPIKTGKKVSGLEFRFIKNPQLQIEAQVET